MTIFRNNKSFIFHFILIASFLSILVSCSHLDYKNNKEYRPELIRKGMSESFVNSLIGQPFEKSPSPTGSGWVLQNYKFNSTRFYVIFNEDLEVQEHGYGNQSWKFTPEQYQYSQSLKKFKEKTLKLKVGMHRNQLVSLLGPPNITEVKTYGFKTDRAWQGVILRYTDFRFQAVIQSHDQLLNSWEWH